MSDALYASMPGWQAAIVKPFASVTGLPPGTVLFTLALFASFSGSRKVSCFLPVGLGWVVFYFGFCGIEMIELMDDVSSSA